MVGLNTANDKDKKKNLLNMELLYNTIPEAVLFLEITDSCRIIYVNDVFYEMLGVEKDFQGNLNDLIFQSIYPKDLEEIKQKYQNHLEQFGKAVIEYRINQLNGLQAWHHASVLLLKKETNKQQIISIVRDITVQKKKFFQLEMEKERFQIISELANDRIWEYDYESDCLNYLGKQHSVFLNDNKVKNFLKENSYCEIIHPDDRDKFCHFCRQIEQKLEKVQLEFRVKQNGSYIWYLVFGTLMHGKHGYPDRMIGQTRNISQEKKESLKLLQESQLDTLTGIYNRKTLYSLIQDFITQNQADVDSGMMLIDVDNFSKLNRKMGHLFGDAVLVNIVEGIKNIIPKDNIFGRIGADRFVLFLKNASREAGIALAENICRMLSHIYSGESEDTKLSCSIGMAGYPWCGSCFESVFEKADKALYRAKQLGKNRYYIWDSNSQDSSEVLLNQYMDFVDWQESSVIAGNDNRSFINLCHHIFGNTKNLDSAIKLLMDRLGVLCGLDQVCIVEYTYDHNYLHCTYLWQKEYSKIDKEKELLFSSSIGLEFEKLIGDNDYLLLDNKHNLTLKGQINTEIKPLVLKSSINCGIYDGSLLNGCVSMCVDKPDYLWSNDVKEMLLEFTKAATPYLLKKSAAKEADYKLKKAMDYDVLTGLYTIGRFKALAQEYKNKNPNQKLAVIYSDIDKFKYFNDTYGFAYGDEVLKDYAHLIREQKYLAIYSCRLENDKFLSLVTYEDKSELLERFSRRSREFNLRQKKKFQSINVIVYVGICLLQDSGNNITLAIDNANIARKIAKEQMKDVCLIFHNQMKCQVTIEAEMSNSMEYALEHNEFKVYIQPKVSLKDGKMVGAEALIRWVKPSGEIIPPDRFIPFFEKNGFVTKLDIFVLETVLCKMCKWRQAKKPLVPVSVNMSRLHGDNPHQVEEIMKLLKRYEIPTELVEFELTETAFFEDAGRLIKMMNDLIHLGFGISIDDFGSGYSSLNVLPTIPANILKLDKEFLRTSGTVEKNKILVQYIVSMAKEMGLHVICEGVETKQEVEFLKSIGCEMAQGYYFARPIPIKDFEENWLI